MSNPHNTGAKPTLADVNNEVAKNESLSATRRRDLRSAISRVAALLGEEPAHLPVELENIAARLATALAPAPETAEIMTLAARYEGLETATTPMAETRAAPKAIAAD